MISSHLITYGLAADDSITERIREEIETLWNQAKGEVIIAGTHLPVRFQITAQFKPDINPLEVLQNDDPKNNYFRIEEFAHGNISFVDGIGCNTGYFLLDNLYAGSTTAAHEYGHTIGLHHPKNLDIRGEGRPGIMYPRGTIVDAQFQYNPAAQGGDNKQGGTMHPQYRVVTPLDIVHLKLHKLNFIHDKAILGNFTSIWHENHRDLPARDVILPNIMA